MNGPPTADELRKVCDKLDTLPIFDRLAAFIAARWPKADADLIREAKREALVNLRTKVANVPVDYAGQCCTRDSILSYFAAAIAALDEKARCEHPPDRIIVTGIGASTETFPAEAICMVCKATRSVGYLGDWQEKGAGK